ncbi:ATP-dependent RNA helicase HrpA [Leucobacter aridicollis]|uniref:ATP-dependent helicase HrpA n=1 Tax=Leucobacter aridicollis TaxID=283878 RepID=A0A852R435_9MICO|nr:ATP-dependent RNA helicase HrpA [Leucobacter aridicollis]MBL3682877.1 ATP-dependent RNA helicase HrpA [Leucobacter aridicollis]NYD26315.1 ATP-dependent helicase HrpA [Leucobacter aridicollis]
MSNPEGHAPRIEFPEELPVSQMRDEIQQAISDHQVVIVAGETGSGKTTQLPKIALALGRERIAHTQPRRIAARTIAERIAEETGTELGGLVGYQVRFTDQASKDTKIRLMTDGILLNAIHRDRDLKAYDTIIIDEAHERSLNIDFLLGYLRTLLPRRPDLKVIITSATIDPESFAKHFADHRTGEPAPIIEVSGRTYPVEIRYRPLIEEREVVDPKTKQPKTRKIERDVFEAIGEAVDELGRESRGDVLVFLSGEAEIRDAADALQGRAGRGGPANRTEILPLYGRLSAAEQHRVFERRQDSGARRIVLATNVAETSLTVPGIRYVIDAGTARISRYSSRSKVQRLPIEAISQASANQRSGRSGRTSNGIAIRLYSEEDFESRPAFTEPEIRRTGLASVILQMLSLGLGDIAGFPFLTPPDQRGIRDGLGLLEELGAVRPASRGRAKRDSEAAASDGATSGGATHAITKTGRELARLPIEPRFARMVIEARRHEVVPEVLAIVAGLTIQDVRERPVAERAQADQFHARFNDPLGDLMTLLNLWNHLQKQQAELSSSAFRRLCKKEFLNFLRVREWMDLVRQLSRAAGVKGQVREDTGGSAELIHRSVLAGLLSQLGVRDDRQDRTTPGRGREVPGAVKRKPAQEYLGSRGTRFVLYPGSVLAKKPPEVVMSVELVETSRLFARSNAQVEPEWAEELAGSLAKRQLSEPRWERKQGAAVATERVTLYGVPIVTGRRVQLSRFDPVEARELFIRHALVDGDWDSPQAFDRANHQLRRELVQLEERTRRRDILDGDEAVFEFYDARIPKDVASTRDFEGWWKTKRSEDPQYLHLKREDLLEEESVEVDEAEYPRQWQHGDQSLKLKYRFDPTSDDDGVTVNVPLPLLPRLAQGDFEKLVPGMREELVTALIKTLPKAIRKHVVPAADWARTLLSAVGPKLDGDGAGGADVSLTQLLADEIRRRTSQQVQPSDFDPSRLPAHLTPTFRVIDARGRTVGAGKDLAELQAKHKEQATKGVARVAQAALPKSELERTGATTWEFGDLPKHVDSSYAKGRSGSAGVVRAYPAIVDRRTSVDLGLVADEAEQRRASRRGIRRLVVLSSPSPASYVRDHLSNQEKLLLGAGPYRSLDTAIADVSLAVADRVIQRHAPDGLVWRAADFEAIANDYARSLIDEIYGTIALTAKVLDGARLAKKAIDQAKSLQVLGQVADAAKQLDGLVFDGFVSRTGATQLERVPVYLEALRLRMQALPANPGRDRAWQNDVDRALVLFDEAGGKIPLPVDAPAHIERTRWLIEEFRVSLFAQQLRASEAVSLQRIQKALAG